nr:hypothetical protein [Tanacetum cinerariifolium]
MSLTIVAPSLKADHGFRVCSCVCFDCDLFFVDSITYELRGLLGVGGFGGIIVVSCRVYGSGLLILQAYALSMPPLSSLPLSMVYVCTMVLAKSVALCINDYHFLNDIRVQFLFGEAYKFITFDWTMLWLALGLKAFNANARPDPFKPRNVGFSNMGLIYLSARRKNALSMKIKRIKDVVKFSSKT